MKRLSYSSFGVVSLLLALVFVYNNCGQMPGSNTGVGNGSRINDIITGNPFGSYNVAALPKIFLVSDFPELPVNHKTLYVGAKQTYSSCQSAVDAASPGDEVIIDSGYVCAPFILRNKGPAQNYIVIANSNLNLLPAQGNRVSRTDQKNLAVVETDGTVASISTEPLANHYYLVGLEVRVGLSSKLATQELVSIGSDAAFANKTTDNLPHDIIIARSWLHGSPNQEVIRGIDLNGSAISIVDSVIDDIHAFGKYPYEMGQAIGVWNSGYGPFKITNDELVSSGANIGIGEHSTKIPNLIPSDIQVSQNWIHKDLAWVSPALANTGAQGLWPQDSLVHMANAQRILLNGNVFEDLQQQALTSSIWIFALALTPSSGGLGDAGIGAMPWARVQDVTTINNVIRNTPGAFRISFNEFNNPTVVSQRLDFEGNLVYNQTNLATQNSRGIIDLGGQATGPTVFNHNTLLGAPASTLSMVHSFNSTAPYFKFTNNITYSRYGFYDPKLSTSDTVLTKDFPGITFSSNAIAAIPESQFGSYAVGNYFPADSQAVDFIGNLLLGISDFHLLGLQTQSPYYQKASDGLDIGAVISYIDSVRGNSLPQR